MTLRYFATKGSEPIYDRFARKALWSIIEEKKGQVSEPTDSNMPDIYKTYKEMIMEVFKEEYDNRHENLAKWRMVDQALWSYGHCFHVRSI